MATLVLGLHQGLVAKTGYGDAAHFRFHQEGFDLTVVMTNYSPERVHEFLESIRETLAKCTEWNLQRDIEDENSEKEKAEVKTNFPNCSCITDCVCQPDEGE